MIASITITPAALMTIAAIFAVAVALIVVAVAGLCKVKDHDDLVDLTEEKAKTYAAIFHTTYEAALKRVQEAHGIEFAVRASTRAR